MQSETKITPSVLTNIHKLLHSAFEQAVAEEYVPRKPIPGESNARKAFPSEIPMLKTDEIETLVQNCDNPMLSIAIHTWLTPVSLRKGEIFSFDLG